MSTTPVNPASAPLPTPRPALDLVRVVVVAIAALAHLVVAFPFTAASGLVAPLWGIVVAWALWGGGAIALVAIARRRPLATPLVPLINAGLLWLLIVVGEGVFGWTG
jgi:hypothetical protein